MKPEGIETAQKVAGRFGDLVLRTSDAMKSDSQEIVQISDVRTAAGALLVQEPSWKPFGERPGAKPLAQEYFEAWHGHHADIHTSLLGRDMKLKGIPIISQDSEEKDTEETDSLPESSDEASLFIHELSGATLRAIHTALQWYSKRLQRGGVVRKNGSTDIHALSDYATTDVGQMLENTRALLQVALQNAEILYSIGMNMEKPKVVWGTADALPVALRRFLGVSVSKE